MIASVLLWFAGALAAPATGTVLDPVTVHAIQDEPAGSPYDWGPSVMKDGDLYWMWWVRFGGANGPGHPHLETLDDGTEFAFTYPDNGDRIYYAESRDGIRWNLSGPDHVGPPETFGPDATGPLCVFGPAHSAQEIHHVGRPSVIRVEGVFYLYYEAPAAYRLRRDGDGVVAVEGEYHNQIFVATSRDGLRWRRHPVDGDPQPLVAAPASNRRPGAQRYGLGQPSVFYRDGHYVMHYVDSCNGPGDYIVRIAARDPYFRSIAAPPVPVPPLPGGPPGAVARFAQTDVKPLGDQWLLIRPAYGTGRLGLLSAAGEGRFAADRAATHPGDVFPQLATPDPRGDACRERLFPGWLTDPEGCLLLEDGHAVVFYSSGLGFKERADTWDLRRAAFRIAPGILARP